LSTGAPVDAAGRAEARARRAASSALTTGRAGVEIDTGRVRADISASNTDVGTLDWPALTVRAAACTACALCAGRTRSVFGAGHVQADWMIVADAPDADDDRTGLPLSGRAGRLLDNMLDAIRLTRDEADASRQVYVTQSVKCRPPDRNPEPAEVACCEPFLLRQIELLRPRIILAMGRVAAQAGRQRRGAPGCAGGSSLRRRPGHRDVRAGLPVAPSAGRRPGKTSIWPFGSSTRSGRSAGSG
jgi:DNA polymerase